MIKVSLLRSKYFLCRICILIPFAVTTANNTVLSRYTNGSPDSLRRFSQSGGRKRTILWEFISESTCKGFCIQMRDTVTGCYITFWYKVSYCKITTDFPEAVFRDTFRGD